MDGETAISEATAGTADLDARLDGELNIDAANLIAEIKARYEARFVVPAGAFTFRQFVMETGYKKTKAERVLNEAVDNGVLVRRRLEYGARPYVWMRRDDR